MWGTVVAVRSVDRLMWDMSVTVPEHMTGDEFLAWAMEQPEAKRYELVAGEVVAMAPERVARGRMKFRCARRLAEGIEAAKLPCEVFVDGMTVRVDRNSIYEPDVLVRCGPS